MKKIIIADDIKTLMEMDGSFLNRTTVKIFTVASKEEAIDVHTAERANLIVIRRDMPRMNSEKFCSLIRKDEKLRKVSIIITSRDNKAGAELSLPHKPNAIMTEPVEPEILIGKAHQLLHIATRESCRIILGIKVDGKYKSRPFLCHMENISASGMLLVTDKVLSKGDVIKCSFYLPNSKRIMAEGEIVRIVRRITEFDAYQYGIRFLNLPRDCKVAIEAFIEERSQKKYSLLCDE